MVLGMLCGLTVLFHRWVLSPVRMLQRGVRHVARGSFDYKINLRSGDEMQDLAEAFNDMTAQDQPDLSPTSSSRCRSGAGSSSARSGWPASASWRPASRTRSTTRWRRSPSAPRPSTTGSRGCWPSANDPDLGTVPNYLKMIQEEAFRCKNITEKLLDFSRCNDITRERIDLSGLIQGVVEMIQHIGKYRGKRVHVPPARGGDGARRQPGDQAGRPEPDRQCAGIDGSSGDTADRGAVRPGHGRDGFHRRRLRDGAGGAREHLRAVLHPAARGEGDGAGALDHAPDHQPARRRDHTP